MPDRFFLNALDRTMRQLPVPEAGAWKSDESMQDFLAKYAADIRVEGQLKEIRGVNHVPSVFARPIQFYYALARVDHPLHTAVVSQWRGLLAVFALQKRMELTPRAVEYRVAPPRKGEGAGGTRGVGDLHIRTILHSQLPTPREDWERFWLLFCNDRLVGATSPWTIVYAPAQHRCPPVIPWQSEDGLLIDPLEYYRPRPKEKSIELTVVLRWVELLLNQHKWGMPDRLDDMTSAIKRALEAWASDLEPYRDASLSVRELDDYACVREGPYRHFLVGAQADKGAVPAGRPQSELLLRSERTKDRPVLVLSSTGLDPKARVWGSVLVDQLDIETMKENPVGKAGWKTNAGREVPVAYVLVDEVFFPPRLLELPLGEGALSRGTQKYALPLTASFFEFFALKELVLSGSVLHVSEADKTVNVRLRLPLIGGGELTVEKVYAKDTEIVKVPDPIPALALWPDFYTEDWYENIAAYAPSPDPVFTVAPFLADGRSLGQNPSEAPKSARFLWRNRSPAVGFELWLKPNDRLGESVQAGIVLRRSLQPPAARGAELPWHVAIDFGTSNTFYLMRREGARLESRPIKGRTALLTEAEPGLREVVCVGTLPGSDLRPPLPSLLVNVSTIPVGVASSSPDRRDSIMPEFHLFALLLADEERVVHWGFKWGAGAPTEDVPLIRSYLGGIVQYIACEARAAGAERLELSWSYPLALPPRLRGAMEGFWQNAGSELCDREVMPVLTREPLPESAAICRCLAAIEPPVLDIHAESLSIGIDVGGGSTDIGFWSETQLLDQISLKLAGNDLVPRLLDPKRGSDRELLAELYAACRGGLIPDHLGRIAPVLLANSLLMEARGTDGEPYRLADPQQHPVVRSLYGKVRHDAAPWVYPRTLMYLFFMGIAFYVGLHSRRHASGKRQVGLYLGGLGASGLPWVTGQGSKTRKILEHAVKEGLTLGVQENKTIEVRAHGPVVDFTSSIPPKHEVSIGLLSPALKTEQEGGAAGQVRRVWAPIAGERGWMEKGGREVQWNEELAPGMAGRLTPPENLESSYMAHLVKSVLPVYVDELGLDSKGLKSLRIDSARAQEYLRRGDKGEDSVLQPIFICELAALLDSYVALIPRQQKS